MTKAWMKFLMKLNIKLRNKLEIVVGKILVNDFDGLDIKQVIGKNNYFRVRIGGIRIIFIKSEDENIIDDIGYRGDIYKGL